MDDAATGEGCSTPRNASASISDVLVSRDRVSSESKSDESEADILERSIRLSGGNQQFSYGSQPTTVLSGSIMHTSECSSYFPDATDSFTQLVNPSIPGLSQPPQQQQSPSFAAPQQQTRQQFVQQSGNYQQNSAPSLQQTNQQTPYQLPPTESQQAVPPQHSQTIPSNPQQNMPPHYPQNSPSNAQLSSPLQPPQQTPQPPPTTLHKPMPQLVPFSSSVPLMDISQIQARPVAPPSSYLGKRPSGPIIAPSAPPADTAPPPQGQIPVSPITSPNTTRTLTLPMHWYHSNPDGSWKPFSYLDSRRIEEAYSALQSGGGDGSCEGEAGVLSTDGGRYDVRLGSRQRVPAYWSGISSAIRRCSWFYRGNHDIMQPYSEERSTLLEEHYVTAVKLRTFPMRVELGPGEAVIINSRTMMVHYQGTQPKLVRRGVPDEALIPPDEPDSIDHVVFVLHGIGSVADLKFRSFVDCVSDMRVTCQQLVSEHWGKITGEKEATTGQGRVEFLPIQWHAALHNDSLGVDRHISKLTLGSIPLLRDFVNNTCVDVLFYTSPFYCQTIIEQCGREMNRLYGKFRSRNPTFSGNVSIVGHSLGSVIAFDILTQQSKTSNGSEDQKHSQMNTSSTDCIEPREQPNATTAGFKSTDLTPVEATTSQNEDSTTGSYEKSKYSRSSVSGTGQPQVNAVQLDFHVEHMFAIGSPLGLFLAVRGVHSFDENFSLPTCQRFYNIFHPYDPVAYKLEPLLRGNVTQPVTLPHHKGRKRMHKEITDQLARMGAAVKNQLSSTLSSLYSGTAQDPAASTSSSSVVEPATTADSSTTQPVVSTCDRMGSLNSGDRVDYVLQESPLELVNEYLFSLSSHLCYWTSEDTVLLIVREMFRRKDSVPSSLPLV